MIYDLTSLLIWHEDYTRNSSIGTAIYWPSTNVAYARSQKFFVCKSSSRWCCGMATDLINNSQDANICKHMEVQTPWKWKKLEDQSRNSAFLYWDTKFAQSNLNQFQSTSIPRCLDLFISFHVSPFLTGTAGEGEGSASWDAQSWRQRERHPKG